MSFVCENRWKPTDSGVTPKDLPTDKNTKIGGCLYFFQYHNIYIGVQIIKYKIFRIENLTAFFTSGGNYIGPKYTHYRENVFAGFSNRTIVAKIFVNL